MIQVGIGNVNIPIDEGTHMGGYGARTKPSTGTHDVLHAKTLAVDVDGTVSIITSCDLVGLEFNSIVKLKGDISKEFKVPVENILIAATHTHSGPRNIALFGYPYKGHEVILEKITYSIRMAMGSMFPATLFEGSGAISNVTFNRRTYDESSDFVDDECVVVTIKNEDGEVVGVVYNYSCHPVVMGADNLLISADWPYYANERIKGKYPHAIPIFLQGSSGNLNPVNTPIVGEVPPHDFNDCKEIGDRVGNGVIEIMEKSTRLDATTLSGSTESVTIVADDEDKDEIFTFASGRTENGEFTVTSLVQSIVLGELVIVGIPGELFAEIGLNIKKQSAGKTTMVVGYANDYIGYISSRDNYIAGGYEVMMMSLCEEEGEIIEKAVLSTLEKNNKQVIR